jgi:hypothetical protein
MNAANTAANTVANSGLQRPLLGIVFFILVIVALYYIYQYLYGSNPAYASVDILPGNAVSTTQTANFEGQSLVSSTALKGILDGGQYSVSMWMYVADTKGFSNNKLAHILEISNKRFATDSTAKGNTLLFVGLNPTNGTLVVRQSSSDESEMINNSTTDKALDTLITGYSSFSSGDDKCDIINGIEYQRWILVTVVGNGRTLDVYVDGKLARSCVYKAPFALASGDGSATAYIGLGNDNSLKGFFSSGKFYNYALTPDAIWALYQAGPSGSFSLGSFFSNLFSTGISFSSSSDMNPATE